MTKRLLLLSLFIVLVLNCTLYATLLWTEDFTIPPFSAGSTVVGVNGWATHSGMANPWVVIDSGLSYANYSYPSLGGAIQTSAMTGYDINKTFTAINSGNIYVAFLFNANSTGWISPSADYEVNLGTTPSSFYTKVYFKRDATLSNKFTVGISKSSAAVSAVYGTTIYDTGTTYLFIIKYSFIDGTANDEVRLWINPPTPGTETTPTIISNTEITADPTNITAFMLRQGTSTPPAIYDAIKIGTTWDDVYPVTSSISVNPTSLSFLTSIGTTSAYQSYTLTCIDLTDSIAISVPASYEVSMDNIGPWVSSFKVPPTYNGLIYVHFNPLLDGVNNGNVSNMANDLITNVALNGIGTIPLNVPTNQSPPDNNISIWSILITTILNWEPNSGDTEPSGYLLSWNGNTSIDIGNTTSWTTPLLSYGYYKWKIIPYKMYGSFIDYADSSLCPWWYFKLALTNASCSDSIINFDTQYLGTTTEYTITVHSTGSDSLHITNVHWKSGNPAFSYASTDIMQGIAPGDSATIHVSFHPISTSTISDSLIIESNAVNLPIIKVKFSGKGAYVPPKEPDNLQINMSNNNAQLSWEAVTQSILETPLIPDYYFVYFNGSSVETGPFYFLGLSHTTTYQHENVSLGSEYMFYRIKAIKLYSRSMDVLEQIKPCMTEEKVDKILGKNE